MKSIAILVSLVALAGATSTSAEAFTPPHKSDPSTVIAYAVQLSCLVMDPKNPASEGTCWGALIGNSGRYAGKTGSFTQMGTNASGTGQGAWRD